MAFTSDNENLLTDVTLRNIDGRQPESARSDIWAFIIQDAKRKIVPLRSPLTHKQ